MTAKKFHMDLGPSITQDLAPDPPAETPPAPAAEPGHVAAGPPEPMTAAEVAATPRAQRKQLNIAPPTRLDLHRRATLYRLAYGIDIQDQGALALDAWLREQGF